jgi:hypothetical protein
MQKVFLCWASCWKACSDWLWCVEVVRVVQLDGELQTAVEDPKVETETNLESGVQDPNARPETELECGVQGPLAETGTELEPGVQDSKAAEHAESAVDREGILPVPDSSPQKEAAGQTCGDSSPGEIPWSNSFMP